MSFAFHFGLWTLALSLGPGGHVPPTYRPPSSFLSSPQSPDPETVRVLTEKYGLSIAAGDLETMRQLWDPQSPNLATRLKLYQNRLATSRIEFLRMDVSRVEVTGDKALSHLTTDERRVDKRTGVVVTESDAFHGICRALEWIKTPAGWRIEGDSLVQDDLAARLDAAASDRERAELLAKEREFVTDVLVNALIQRGAGHRGRGDFDAALHCTRLAQSLAEEIGDQGGVAAAWLELGFIKRSQDEYEQALTPLQKALEVFEGAGLKRGVALTLVNLGEAYRELGDYQQAFQCEQRSLKLYEETGNRGEWTARALEEIAYVYEAQNNFEQALAFLERAMTIAQEAGDKIRIAILRYAMAAEQFGLGNYERALEIYREILKQTESFGDRGGSAYIRKDIGSIYAQQGRHAEALDYFRQSLSTFETVDQKRGITQALVSMSEVQIEDRKYSEALPLLQRAVLLSRQMGQKISLWWSLTILGDCQLGLNHREEARIAFDEAVTILEKLRTQTAGGVQDRRRYLEGWLRAHHGMLRLLAEEDRPIEALAFAERSKARVLLDVLQNGRVSVDKAMTGEQRELEHRLRSDLNVLNRRMTDFTQSEDPDPQRLAELEARLEKARLDYEAFQTSLYAAHPELRIYRGEAPIIKSEELAAMLPDTASALLEYVVTDDQSYLFAITRAAGKTDVDVQLYTLPIRRVELGKQAEAFRQQLAARDLGFRVTAAKLYELLLKPAQAQLIGKANLVIVPDDKLWELPFQALVTRANRFLIEDAAIAYAPSLTVLREMTMRRTNQDRRPASPALLALANPSVGTPTIELATTVLRDAKLLPLPEAEQEVKAVGKLYGVAHSKIYIGPKAREDRVKREAGQADILHFATHGTLNNASPMYSHLVLAQGDSNEDGLLEAWEIAQLDLKADLVILSACETARGRYGAGEGLIGLTWAMFVAGVPRTVVSQWKVEAASTRDLLVDFHRSLNRHLGAGKPRMTASESLRHAALKVMKNPEINHPFYWAGFVIVGDGG